MEEDAEDTWDEDLKKSIKGYVYKWQWREGKEVTKYKYLGV